MARNFTGNATNEVILGTLENDFLDGLGGDDSIHSGAGNDTVFGGEGNDEILGGIGDDAIAGGHGNDLIEGGDGSDTIQGDAGDDTIEGGADADLIDGGYGNDFINGNGGNDTLNGEAGNDTLIGSADTDIIDGGNDDDSLKGNNGDDYLSGGDGADTIEGGEGNDKIFGNEGNDLLIGNNGNDTLEGNTGNDTIIGSVGNDVINGGAGHDVLNYSGLNRAITLQAGGMVAKGDAGTDNFTDLEEIIAVAGFNNTIDATSSVSSSVAIAVDLSQNELTVKNIPHVGDLDLSVRNFVNVNGTNQADSITGNSSDNLLQGNDGNDTINGLGGSDTVLGGAGNDSINGGLDADTLRGGDGHDTIRGFDGDDLIDGGAGNDDLFGGEDGDRIFGGEGNDLIEGNGGNDTLEGGSGEDTVSGGIGNDSINGGLNNDTLQGGDGNDTVRGFDGLDILKGGAGNDSLIGGADEDTIFGGSGNDYVDASSGDDLVYGDNTHLDGSAIAHNLITNGSFEHNSNHYGTWKTYHEIEGWQRIGHDIEIHKRFKGYQAADGHSWAEIDAGGIVQSVNTEAGATYQVSFEYSPRPHLYAHDNILKVYWNGELIDTIAESGRNSSNTQWNTFTYEVAASNNDFTALEFRAGGVQNHKGALLDNVRVKEVLETNLETNNDFLIGGDGKDTLDGGIGNDTLKGSNGDDTLYGDNNQFAQLSQQTFVYNGNTYFLTTGAITWEHAQTQAVSFGGNLVTINNSAEQNWLRSTFGGHQDFWIGLTDKNHEGNFQWASGEAVTYTNWAAGEPNNFFNEDYAAMNFRDRNEWNDSNAHQHFKGIIEVNGVVTGGNDLLVGGDDNDNLYGGLGDDTLNGANTHEAGFHEKDHLFGGTGKDTFVLGDETFAYYLGDGHGGYAVIKDFNLHEDTIELNDDAHYWLGSNHGNSYLYANNENNSNWDKVAIIEDVHLNNHDLNGEGFEYV